MKINNTFTLLKYDDINLRKYSISFKNYKPKIKAIVEYLLQLKELKKSKIFNYELSKIRFDIAFCNDESIRKINKDYRNKDSATDVITFSLFCDDKNAIIYRKTADLGQIIVSIETADKQKKTSLEEEILILITHGILHLFGFDHLTKRDYDFVIKIQNKVINELRN